VIVEKLGYMPLAIDHAGAFIHKLHIPLPKYLPYYETAFATVQSEKPELGWKYRDETAMKTWEASFSVIENPVASKILLMCSFLNHEDIWDDLFFNTKIVDTECKKSPPSYFSVIHSKIL